MSRNTFRDIADWMETQVEELETSFRLPDGSMDDAEVAAEVEGVKRWIEFLRQQVTSAALRSAHSATVTQEQK